MAHDVLDRQEAANRVPHRLGNEVVARDEVLLLSELVNGLIEERDVFPKHAGCLDEALVHERVERGHAHRDVLGLDRLVEDEQLCLHRNERAQQLGEVLDVIIAHDRRRLGGHAQRVPVGHLGERILHVLQRLRLLGPVREDGLAPLAHALVDGAAHRVQQVVEVLRPALDEERRSRAHCRKPYIFYACRWPHLIASAIFKKGVFTLHFSARKP